MNRIAAFVLLAGVAGGCASTDAMKSPSKGSYNTASRGKEIPGVVGATGEPVMSTAATSKATKAMKNDSGVVQASATSTSSMNDGNVTNAGYSRVIGGGYSSGLQQAGCSTGNCGGGSGYPQFNGHGILPAPPMGPAGAVAYVPGYGGGGPGGNPNCPPMRSAIKFIGPASAKVSWFAGGTYAEPGLVMPAEYNFTQGNVYSLKVWGIANAPGKVYYPTIEIAAATPKSITFLDHSTVPVSFSDEDLKRVDSGNMVVKVIYLPDSLYQDVTSAVAVDEVVSTQLDPGTDPIVEANRRGTILAIIRLGNINRENPSSPAKDAPPQMGMPGPGAYGVMPMSTPGPLPATVPGVNGLPAIPAANVPAMPVSRPSQMPNAMPITMTK